MVFFFLFFFSSFLFQIVGNLTPLISSPSSNKPYAHQMVRTDDRLQTLDGFMSPISRTNTLQKSTSTSTSTSTATTTTTTNTSSPLSPTLPQKRSYQDEYEKMVANDQNNKSSLLTTSNIKALNANSLLSKPHEHHHAHDPIGDDEELGTRSRLTTTTTTTTTTTDTNINNNRNNNDTNNNNNEADDELVLEEDSTPKLEIQKTLTSDQPSQM